MTIAEHIKAKRKEFRLTQVELAERAGVGLRFVRELDRGKKGQKYSMLDMCQLSNRLTEHKYLGSYEQMAQTIVRYSVAPYLDVQKFKYKELINNRLETLAEESINSEKGR